MNLKWVKNEVDFKLGKKEHQSFLKCRCIFDRVVASEASEATFARFDIDFEAGDYNWGLDLWHIKPQRPI